MFRFYADLLSDQSPAFIFAELTRSTLLTRAGAKDLNRIAEVLRAALGFIIHP
jgi:hypothetical protein